MWGGPGVCHGTEIEIKEISQSAAYYQEGWRVPYTVYVLYECAVFIGVRVSLLPLPGLQPAKWPCPSSPSPQSTSWPIPQCYYWISGSQEGAYITSPFINPPPPSPPSHSFFHSSFSFFNNSLSSLWPLIKMNSLCCRLLPSSPSQSSPFSFAFYWPSSLNLTPSHLPSSLHLHPPPLPSIPQFTLFLPVCENLLSSLRPPLLSVLLHFSPRLTQQSIMRQALDASLSPDALIHQDFEKQKSLSPLLRWPLPLIALSITPGGWSIRALPLCLSPHPPALFSHHISPYHHLPLLFYSTLYFLHVSASLLPSLMWENWTCQPLRKPETLERDQKDMCSGGIWQSTFTQGQF